MSEDHSAVLNRRAVLQISAAVIVAGAVAAPAQAQTTTTVAAYILKRLAQNGVKHLFGVPGATCDGLFSVAAANGVTPVITASDLEAGYAADGYARLNGLGAVAVTRGVGTLSLAAAIAGAHAERSPVVLINGGPKAVDIADQAAGGALYSHSVGKRRKPASGLPSDLNVEVNVFRELTCYSARIEKASEAPGIVDAAITAALTQSRPVYVEIDEGIWGANCKAPAGRLSKRTDPSGQEAVAAATIINRLTAAAKPALLIGVEIARYGLAAEAVQLIARLNSPYATSLLAKSVLAEDTPGFAGVYDGDRSPASVIDVLEKAGFVLALGCVFGPHERNFLKTRASRIANVTEGFAKLPGQPPVQVEIGSLLTSLLAAVPATYHPAPARVSRPPIPRRPVASAEPGLTYDQVMDAAGAELNTSMLAVTDTSLSMYAASTLPVTGTNAFVANALWQSIGYSPAAALGIGLAGTRRPLVICGDGGFQMTAQSLSSLVRHNVRAIVIVLDNGLYAIEQYLLDKSYFRPPLKTARSYLKLNAWNYADLAKAMGVEFARRVATPAELQQALTQARDAAGPALIHAIVRPHDLPSELRPV